MIRLEGYLRSMDYSVDHDVYRSSERMFVQGSRFMSIDLRFSAQRHDIKNFEEVMETRSIILLRDGEDPGAILPRTRTQRARKRHIEAAAKAKAEAKELKAENEKLRQEHAAVLEELRYWRAKNSTPEGASRFQLLEVEE